ncbi:MAG: hypothetical protein LBE56_05225 [Tannerella sp.]|jgi:hypothetical protein|nr:hypothetical protein [Tannerella sp.]
MKKIIYVLIALCAFVVVSCSDADLLTTDSNVDLSTRSGVESVDEDITSPEEYLTITYEGKTYKSVPTAYNAARDFVFLDDEFSALYEKEISLLPELSIFMVGENEIELYKNLDELLEKKKITLLQEVKEVKIEGVQLRAGNVNEPGYLMLYDDKDFKDRLIDDYLNFSRILTQVPNLDNSPYNFNDKCSSLRIYNNLPANGTITLPTGTHPCTEVIAVFIGYDDKNYADRTIVGFDTIGAGAFEAKSLPNFNDKLSSYKFFFGQNGYYPATI